MSGLYFELEALNNLRSRGLEPTTKEVAEGVALPWTSDLVYIYMYIQTSDILYTNKAPQINKEQ